jgi:hypothetical protein
MGTPGCAMEIESSQGVDYIIHHIKRKKKKNSHLRWGQKENVFINSK